MRLFTTVALVIILAGPLVFIGCGKSEEKSSLDKITEAAKNMQTAAEEISKSAKEERTPVPPVSYKVLLRYLPETMEGLKRSEPEGETSSVGEWRFSQASASYSAESGSQHVNVEIFDYAHIGMLYTPYTIMLKMNYNKEGTSGYERSVEIAGFPAYETWSVSSKSAEANVLVGDRFIVKVTTNDLPEGFARRVLSGMNLKNLAGEKSEPAS